MVVRIQRETTLNLTKEENHADKCFWREEQSISPETLESALSKKQTKTSFNWFSENKNAKTKDRDKHGEIKLIPKQGKHSHSWIFLLWKGHVFQVTESTSVQKSTHRERTWRHSESPDLDEGKMKVGLFSSLQLAQALRTARALMPRLGTTPLRLPFSHPRQQSDPSLVSHESHRKGERTRKVWFNNRHSEGVPVTLPSHRWVIQRWGSTENGYLSHIGGPQDQKMDAEAECAVCF